MTEIFAGEVEFTTPRPFESSSARVKLSFTVANDELPETATWSAGQMARQIAERMVRGTAGEILPAVAQEPEVRPTKRRTVSIATPVAPAAELDTASVAVSAEAPQPDPFLAAGAVAQSATASAPASDTASNEAQPTPEPEITDAMLQDAITKKNGDVRNTQAIKALIVSYTKDPLVKVYTLGQPQRVEFLAQLAAL